MYESYVVLYVRWDFCLLTRAQIGEILKKKSFPPISLIFFFFSEKLFKSDPIQQNNFFYFFSFFLPHFSFSEIQKAFEQS